VARSLFDPYESAGLWTIAGSDLDPQPGTLHFDPQAGPKLSIQWLPKEQFSEWLRTGSWQSVTVTGDAGMGFPVTLEECFVGAGKALQDRACLEVHASRAYLGMKEADPSSTGFCSVTFTATQLSSWCSRYLTGFPDPGTSFLEVEEDEFVVNIRYRRPDPIVIELPEATVHLGMAYTVAPSGRSAGVKEWPQIHVTSKEPQACDSFLEDYVLPLRDLLTLATTAPCGVENYSFVRPKVGEGDEVDPWERRVDLLHVAPTVDRPIRDRVNVEMLFDLSDVEGRVPDVVKQWLQLHRRARYAMSQYFGTRYARDEYVETRFLSIVQAYEALDRRTGKRPADSKGAEDFGQRVIEAAGDRLSELDIERLTAALVFPQQASLHDRIAGLGNEASYVVRSMVFDSDSLARSVVKTRNYLTHGTDSRWAVRDTKELYQLTEVLDYLFQNRLLAELGFDVEFRSELFRRNWNFREGRRHWW
jgi:hypothetical protein